ncbi:hypothetical protein DB42_CE00010, partial [Neochlamydia sp. EPS4]|uniref:DUF294 nucleotidyltransferase-like domain-containing protein n=1 Tax=Neochlamydia sp. EPS4 TaxID=1478175 RepID=UPI000583B559
MNINFPKESLQANSLSYSPSQWNQCQTFEFLWHDPATTITGAVRVKIGTARSSNDDKLTEMARSCARAIGPHLPSKMHLLTHYVVSEGNDSFHPHIQGRIGVKTTKNKRFSIIKQDLNEDATRAIFDPSNPLATLPLEIFQRIFLSFSSLNDDELRKILEARSCARVFKQHLPTKAQLLTHYHPHKLPGYLDKIARYLEKIIHSIDENNNPLPETRLEEMEEAYMLALKLAIQKNEHIQESFCIEKLGDVYVVKGTFEALLQAAGLYNYALHLASREQQKIIRNRLVIVHNLLVRACKGKPLDAVMIEKQFEDNRKALKEFREEIEEKIQRLQKTPSFQQVRNLYGKIAQGIKAFFGLLVEQSIETLGPASCEYAMIGFGSLARQEMTLYSDLEFGILMQTDNPENRDYFKRLTTLIHLKVINLGETILPALNIPCLKAISFFDGITPRGFAFDGAGVEGKGCKTPFGNGTTFELIQTPEQMAQYIAEDEHGKWWHEKEPHLPMELLNFTHLLGNVELTKTYDGKIQEKLNTFYQEGLNLRKYLAKQHLVLADMKAFYPGIGDPDREGMLFQVKNDFYRFLHLALDRLALLKKVSASNTFIRIDKLKELGVITNGATEKLREWMNIVLFMRLKTYSHYQGQQERMNPLIKPFEFDDPELIKKQFAVDPELLEKIKKIYRIFIPFYNALQKFLEGHKDSLKSSDLEDNSPQILGDIAWRLHQQEEAKKYYKLAKKESPKDAAILYLLGIIYKNQGNLN